MSLKHTRSRQRQRRRSFHKQQKDTPTPLSLSQMKAQIEHTAPHNSLLLYLYDVNIDVLINRYKSEVSLNTK